MAPGSEAPAEMLWYIEEKKAIETAEDATHTLHNTYSLRGAKIREPLPWSKYLNEALTMWGDEAEVIFAQHHWPTWGNDNVRRAAGEAARPLPLHQRPDAAAWPTRA